MRGAALPGNGERNIVDERRDLVGFVRIGDVVDAAHIVFVGAFAPQELLADDAPHQPVQHHAVGGEGEPVVELAALVPALGPEPLAVRRAQVAQRRALGQHDPRLALVVAGELVAGVGVVAAVVEEPQRGPAREMAAAGRRLDGALVDVPVGDVEARVAQHVRREVGGRQVDPALVDEQPVGHVVEAVAAAPLGPPVEELRRPRSPRPRTRGCRRPTRRTPSRRAGGGRRAPG